MVCILFVPIDNNEIIGERRERDTLRYVQSRLVYIIVCTVFHRLECMRSINFILVLRGGLFEGMLRSRAHSIELKPAASSQFI